jgi:hypothetical protein
MHLINNGGDDEGKVSAIIITIIVLACVITVGFGIYIFFLVKDKKQKRD